MNALALALMFVVAGATDATPPCVAGPGLKLSTQGRFVDVAAGASVVVVTPGAPWSTVEVDGVRGKIWSEKLKALCRPAEAATTTSPATAEPETAAPTTTAASTEATAASTPPPEASSAPTPAAKTGQAAPGETALAPSGTSTISTGAVTSSAAPPNGSNDDATRVTSDAGSNTKRPLPRAIRVAVRPFQAAKADAHLAKVTTDALVAELRKLERLSVVDMEEVKALLDLEAEKQLVGCEDESCLAEIVEALGADVLIVGSISTLEQERVFGLKRLDAHDLSGSATFNKRLAIRGGEECLAAVGIATEKLFGDFPLKAGRTRGVADEVAIRLTPPPLPAWVTYGAFGVTAVAGAVTLAAGVANAAAYANGQEALQAGSGAIDATELDRHNQDVSNTFTVLVAAGTTTLVVGALSVVSAVWLTDWDDLSAEMEKARTQE